MKAYDLTALQDVDVAVAGDTGTLQTAERCDYTADETDSLLILAARARASDLHLTVGVPPVLRVYGKLWKLDELAKNGPGDVRRHAAAFIERHPGMAGVLTPEKTEQVAEKLFGRGQYKRQFAVKKNVDLSYAIPSISRFRVNIFRQRGSVGIVCRVLSDRIPDLKELFSYALSTADVMLGLARLPRGLVLVTGPTGSGKSTTLAALIDYINENYDRHVITLEDPIEYLHHHKKSLVNQREIGEDVDSFANGLRAALREDPDVILVGEMRNLETIATAITAAETGHLVLSTLHTNTAAETVERIIDVFPPHQQQQVRVQLAGVLQGVLSQQLLPRRDGRGRVCAVEVMVATHAVRALVREGKTHMIPGTIQTGLSEGMVPMDKALADLVLSGLVDREEALEHAVDPKLFARYLGGGPF